MSDIELHIGKLRKIDLKGKSIEDYCKQKCKEHNINKTWLEDTWLDTWNFAIDWNDRRGTILRFNKTYFEIIENEQKNDEFIQELKDNGDGTYDYIMMFYNGGICLSQMIEESLDKLKSKEE